MVAFPQIARDDINHYRFDGISNFETTPNERGFEVNKIPL